MNIKCFVRYYRQVFYRSWRWARRYDCDCQCHGVVVFQTGIRVIRSSVYWGKCVKLWDCWRIACRSTKILQRKLINIPGEPTALTRRFELPFPNHLPTKQTLSRSVYRLNRRRNTSTLSNIDVTLKIKGQWCRKADIFLLFFLSFQRFITVYLLFFPRPSMLRMSPPPSLGRYPTCWYPFVLLPKTV